jgi:hypothetical protein
MREKGWRGFGVTQKVFERELMFWRILSERRKFESFCCSCFFYSCFCYSCFCLLHLSLASAFMILSVFEMQRILQDEHFLLWKQHEPGNIASLVTSMKTVEKHLQTFLVSIFPPQNFHLAFRKGSNSSPKLSKGLTHVPSLEVIDVYILQL